MLGIKKNLLISLCAALTTVCFFVLINSVLNSDAVEVPIKSHLELVKIPEKNNELTPEVLDAILELENTQLGIFEKPNDYSTRFYRIDANYPRVLEVHYYENSSRASFLHHNENISSYTDFTSVEDFLIKNPDQKILVRLSSLEGKHFLENAYFYRPDGYVFDVDMACHQVTRCNPISLHYDLDEKKIFGNGTRVIRRNTKLERPMPVDVPPYPKTKP